MTQESTSSAPATKFCRDCETEKPLSEFHIDRAKKSGIQGNCKECRNRKQLAYMHSEHGSETRDIYIKSWKDKIFDALGRKCVRCGFKDERALQIDHIHGGGVREIRALGGTKYYRHILANIQNYQTLCANCNWIKRAERGETR